MGTHPVADSKRSLCMKGTDTPEGKKERSTRPADKVAWPKDTGKPSEPSDYKAGRVCLCALFALEITRMLSLAVPSICSKVDLRESPPSLIAQLVRNPPAMQETLGQFLGREDPLEKGEATRSSILA